MGQKVKIIAEGGINHNGSIENAKKIIDISADLGCDFVKFQKRTPEVCVPKHMWGNLKNTPWGKMTYLDYKYKIEFSIEQCYELYLYGKKKGIVVFWSVWDIQSARGISEFSGMIKIPSALLTDKELLEWVYSDSSAFTLLSTGMSTEEEIYSAVTTLEPDVIFHTNSTYPTPIEEVNLGYLNHLRRVWGEDYQYGYSNHYYGLVPMFASVAMGAQWIEFHMTLDRTLWGSDQVASVEPAGVQKLVKGIRDIEACMKGDSPRIIFPGEEPKRNSLRK